MANNFTRLSAGTKIFGPIHGNEGFRFDGTAHNIVTASMATYFDPDIGAVRPGVWASLPGTNQPDPDDSDHFLAGKKFPVPVVDFSSAVADFKVIKDRAQDSNTDDLYFGREGQGRHIELGVPSSDQMTISTVTSYSANTYAILAEDSSNATSYPIPDEGVVYVEDNVWVEGTLPAGKRLTIAANDDNASRKRSIFIGMGDLRYESYGSDTVLGLMAEDSIHLLRYSKPDLHIDAAMLAQSGNIGWTAPSGYYWGNTIVPPSLITINGALVSNKRMGFGYTNGAGYTNRELIFDADLVIQPPPMFPAGESYAIDLWDEIE